MIRPLRIAALGTVLAISLSSSCRERDTDSISKAAGVKGGDVARPDVPITPPTPVHEDVVLAPAPEPPPTWGIAPFGDTEARTYLETVCAKCHAPSEGASGAWTLTLDNDFPGSVLKDPKFETAKAAVGKRIRGDLTGSPLAMPPSLPTESATDAVIALSRLYLWMGGKDIELPGFGDAPKRQVEYVCSEPATARRFLRRVYNDALNREPTPEEIGAIPAAEVDAPSRREWRDKVIQNLLAENGQRAEFLRTGLRKFATKLSGSNAIIPSSGLGLEMIRDLREEFYQLLLTGWASQPYHDLLLGDVIPVSANTASLYAGCEVPAEEGWRPCTVKKPRGSYFATASFLAAAPSSFLADNNNYGRAKIMHFMISGNVFEAAKDRDSPDEEVPPLPSCLKTKDWRGIKNANGKVAPFGSAIIPASASFCQTCHIDRQMAAASILFRPYSAAGRIYGQDFALTQDPGLEAAAKDRVNALPNAKEEHVTTAFLESLLQPEGEEVCASSPYAANSADQAALRPLGIVKDLAVLLMENRDVVAQGLALHIGRGFSNLPTVPDEVVGRIVATYRKSNGSLARLIGAYFSTETYACGN